MTDTVKLVMEQIDESTDEPISRVTVEWFGSDRNVANLLSMTIAQGVVDSVLSAAVEKANTSAN